MIDTLKYRPKTNVKGRSRHEHFKGKYHRESR